MDSGVLEASERKLTFFHRLTKVETEQVVMTSKVFTVNMDLDARRSTLLDPAVLAGTRAAAARTRCERAAAPHGFTIRCAKCRCCAGTLWVTGRGAINPWDCDQWGHMNVQFYLAKASDAQAVLAARLGLSPSRLRAAGCRPMPVADRILFKRELRAGDIYFCTRAFDRSRRRARSTSPAAWSIS